MPRSPGVEEIQQLLTLISGGLIGNAAQAVALLASWWLVGTGLTVLLHRLNAIRLPWAVSASIGMIFVSVFIPLAYVANLDLPIASLLLLLIAGVVSTCVLIINSKRGQRISHRLIRHDAVSAAISLTIAVCVLTPALVQGSVYWTLDSNDWTQYAAYSDVWLYDRYESEHGSFLTKHPDSFGQWAVTWALFDKPATTGALTFSSVVLGRDAVLLQSPFLVAVLSLTIGLVQAIVRRLTTAGQITTIAVSALVVLGLYPMVFLLSSQVGQIMSIVAMLTVIAVVLLPTCVRTPIGKPGYGLLAVLLGLGVASSLGSNFLMAVAVFPVLGALTAWLLRRSLDSWSHVAKAISVGAVTALVLTVPFAGWHMREVAELATGEVGLKYPLPTPLAFIGLQTGFESISPGWQAIVIWILVIVFVLTYVRTLRPQLLRAGATVFIVALLTVSLISRMVGSDNYAVAKWVAMTQVLVMPVVIATFYSTTREITRKRLGIVLPTVGLLALANAFTLTFSIPYVVPRDLFSVPDDPLVAAQSLMNVDLGNFYEDSAAVLMLNSDTVIAVKPIFSDFGSSPRGVATLIRTGDSAYEEGFSTIAINSTYSIAVRQ